VVHVEAVGVEDRRTSPQATNHREGRIQNWHGESENRYDERQHRELAVALEREKREHVSDEERSGISEKNPSGRKIERQETEQRADHCDTDAGTKELSGLGGENSQGGGNDRSDASREPVEAVNQVDRVRDGDDPDDRHDPTQPRRKNE